MKIKLVSRAPLEEDAHDGEYKKTKKKYKYTTKKKKKIGTRDGKGCAFEYPIIKK
jgi:hypothetical protein